MIYRYPLGVIRCPFFCTVFAFPWLDIVGSSPLRTAQRRSIRLHRRRCPRRVIFPKKSLGGRWEKWPIYRSFTDDERHGNFFFHSYCGWFRNPAPSDGSPMFIGSRPSFWWCGISQPSTVGLIQNWPGEIRWKKGEIMPHLQYYTRDDPFFIPFFHRTLGTPVISKRCQFSFGWHGKRWAAGIRWERTWTLGSSSRSIAGWWFHFVYPTVNISQDVEKSLGNPRKMRETSTFPQSTFHCWHGMVSTDVSFGMHRFNPDHWLFVLPDIVRLYGPLIVSQFHSNLHDIVWDICDCISFLLTTI